MATTNPTQGANPTQTPGANTSTTITTTANDSNHGTKVDLQAAYQGLTTGLLTFYQPTDTFQLKSGTLTRDQLVDRFRQFVSVAESTKAAHVAWRTQVQSEREVEIAVRPLRQAVRAILTARFGKGGTELLQFGFPPAKPRKVTATTKALATVKSKATRNARGTKGKNQKKAIHGTVPGTPPANASGAVAANSAPPSAAPVPVPAGATQSPGASHVGP